MTMIILAVDTFFVFFCFICASLSVAVLPLPIGTSVSLAVTPNSGMFSHVLFASFDNARLSVPPPQPSEDGSLKAVRIVAHAFLTYLIGDINDGDGARTIFCPVLIEMSGLQSNPFSSANATNSTFVSTNNTVSREAMPLRPSPSSGFFADSTDPRFSVSLALVQNATIIVSVDTDRLPVPPISPNSNATLTLLVSVDAILGDGVILMSKSLPTILRSGQLAVDTLAELGDTATLELELCELPFTTASGDPFDTNRTYLTYGTDYVVYMMTVHQWDSWVDGGSFADTIPVGTISAQLKSNVSNVLWDEGSNTMQLSSAYGDDEHDAAVQFGFLARGRPDMFVEMRVAHDSFVIDADPRLYRQGSDLIVFTSGEDVHWQSADIYGECFAYLGTRKQAPTGGTYFASSCFLEKHAEYGGGVTFELLGADGDNAAFRVADFFDVCTTPTWLMIASNVTFVGGLDVFYRFARWGRSPLSWPTEELAFIHFLRDPNVTTVAMTTKTTTKKATIGTTATASTAMVPTSAGDGAAISDLANLGSAPIGLLVGIAIGLVLCGAALGFVVGKTVAKRQSSQYQLLSDQDQ
jgi:hypothetical protein